MFREFCKTVIDYAINVYLLLILCVMPFYNREGFRHIGTDKSIFFNSVCVYMGRILVPVVIVYLISLVVEPAVQRKKSKTKSKAKSKIKIRVKIKDVLSVTDLFAAGFCLTLILSYLCSNYRSTALWGSTGWYMGFWPQMFLISTYFFASKLWKPRKWVLYLGLAASFAVFLIGYLNRFNIDVLGMSTNYGEFISTIGNINWYCGYLVSVFFAGVALLWQWESGKRWQKNLLIIYVTVGFGTLMTQGSDSGLIAMTAAMFVMFCLSLRDSKKMLVFWHEVVLFACACMITYVLRKILPGGIGFDVGYAKLFTIGWMPFVVTLVSFLILASVHVNRKKGKNMEKSFRILAWAFVALFAVAIVIYLLLTTINTIHPGSIGSLSEHHMFTFSSEWGSKRGATWEAGLRCFAEQNFLHKLVGVGPDAMSAFIYQNGSPKLVGLVQNSFGNITLTNAHNEWLTILVNIGLLGLISFAGMMITGIRRYLKEAENNRIVFACGMCLLAYTVNNIFSFQQAMSVATIFTIFGMGEAFLKAEKNIKPSARRRKR